VLGILVLVRITLSISLDVEVEGMAPWRRVETAAKLIDRWDRPRRRLTVRCGVVRAEIG
jgi:hypothetical protein